MTLVNYFPVPHEPLENEKFKKLTSSTKILYIYLLKLNNRLSNSKDKIFFRSIEQLVKDTGLSKSTVIKAKNKLLEEGFIEIYQTIHNSQNNKNSDYFFIKGLKSSIKLTPVHV